MQLKVNYLDLVIEDDPFEVKLDANYRLMAEETREQKHRHRQLMASHVLSLWLRVRLGWV